MNSAPATTEGSEPKQSQARLPVVYVLIALGPIFVFCAAELILSRFAQSSVTYSPDLLGCRGWPGAVEATARLHMLGLGMLVLLGAAGMLVGTCFDLWAKCRCRENLLLFVAALFLVGVGLAFVKLTKNWPSMHPRNRLGSALFDTLANGPAASEGEAFWPSDMYDAFVTSTHVAIILAVAAMTVGSISCLVNLSGRDAAERWRRQSERLKTYATISAAFLIASVFYFKSWATYPAFLLAFEDTKDAHAHFLSLANAYTTYAGIEYSLILAAYVLPVSFVLTWKSERIERRLARTGTESGAEQHSGKSAAKSKNGDSRENLAVKPLEMLKLIIAIISPMITGALTNLFGVVA